VTVTAADASGATGSVSFRYVVVPDLAAGYRWSAGRVVAAGVYSPCLEDTGNGIKNGTTAEFAKCAPSTAKQAHAAQQWAFVPAAAPDGIQTLRIHGKCLAVTGVANGSRLQLGTCDGSARQAWSLEQGLGSLWNPWSGRCLTDPNGAATTAPAEIYDCFSLSPKVEQQFLFPVGPMLSAIGKLCATDPGNSGASGTAVRLEPCNGSVAQDWEDFSAYENTQSGEPTTHHGLCLTSLANVDPTTGIELVEGIPVVVYACVPEPPDNFDYLTGDWVLTTNGEIFNTDANLCLADPRSSTAKGTKLLLEDCDGDAGEIWGVG
jgi:Ricin-type beta-trefoil lectin domain